jgi:hypothetical protein
MFPDKRRATRIFKILKRAETPEGATFSNYYEIAKFVLNRDKKKSIFIAQDKTSFDNTESLFYCRVSRATI